jgi:DNA invertase Pin-like site-specific DNA recombinase
MRRLLTVGLLLLFACVATPAAAQEDGGSERPPTQLWQEYPLETVPSEPPAAGAGTSTTETTPQAQAAPDSAAGEGDGGGIGKLTLAGIGLLAFAAIAGVGVVALRRRPSQVRPAPPVPAETSAAAGTAEREHPGSEAPAAAPAGAEHTDSEPPPAAQPSEPPRVPAAPAAGLNPAARPTNGDGPPASEESQTETAPAGTRLSAVAPLPPQRDVAPADERAIGYTTVAGPKDAENQLRLEARRIQAACKNRGVPLRKLVRDLESNSGADLTRPGLSYALERLGAGEFTCLVVTSLDRLTRSAASLGTLIYLLEERRTRLIVVDIDLDTGTDEGRLAARALVKVSGLERKKLEAHTRTGPDAARDKRRSSGRPAVADRPSLRRRIAEMRAGGMTLQAIADTLNEEGVPTLRGGAQWRPSSVQAAAGYKRPRKTPGRSRPESGSPRE